MIKSTRILIAASLGLGIVAGLVVHPTRAQTDPKVQRSGTTTPATTNANQGARPAAPPAVPAAVIGSLDMERTIQEYQRYKDSSEKFRAEAMKKQGELQNLLAEAKSVSEMRDRHKIGTPDYSKYNDKVAEIQAKYTAEREKLSAQFALEESSTVAEIYNDIRRMTEAVAKSKGMTFVVQVGRNESLSGENPDQVMAALSRNIIYYNPASDITNDVIYGLNYYYKKSKETASNAPAGTTSPATSPTPSPASNPAPGQN